MTKNLGVDIFSDPIGHFGAPGGYFGFYRWCGVARFKRVPPSPLGWYLYSFLEWNKTVAAIQRTTLVLLNFVKNSNSPNNSLLQMLLLERNSLALLGPSAQYWQPRSACNAALPTKSKNGPRGPQNWQWGKERGQPYRFFGAKINIH